MQIVLFPELFEKISFKNMGQVITSIKGNFTHVNMFNVAGISTIPCS